MKGTYAPTTATRKPGIITATVYQWTGASPSMDIMERARRWEAREHDAFVSVFYGFPWSDVPDVGATIQVMTNDDQALADEIADDMSEYMWRVRERFANGTLPQPDEAARIVRAAVATGAMPVAVDDSDRPGDATHILRAFQAAGIGKVLYGTISSPHPLRRCSRGAPRPVIPSTWRSAGTPSRVAPRIASRESWRTWARGRVRGHGGGLLRRREPRHPDADLHTDHRPRGLPLRARESRDYDVFVVKSRVHFRRGFDETGYAKTIVVVEAPGPFVGTTFLDALPYEHADLSTMYPYGTPPGR